MVDELEHPGVGQTDFIDEERVQPEPRALLVVAVEIGAPRLLTEQHPEQLLLGRVPTAARGDARRVEKETGYGLAADEVGGGAGGGERDVHAARGILVRAHPSVDEALSRASITEDEEVAAGVDER